MRDKRKKVWNRLANKHWVWPWTKDMANDIREDSSQHKHDKSHLAGTISVSWDMMSIQMQDWGGCDLILENAQIRIHHKSWN